MGSAAPTSTSSSESIGRFGKVRDIPDLLRILRRRYGDPHWWPGETPFEVAVGAILTQRANWVNAEMAIVNLKRRSMLTPSSIARAPLSELEKMVRPSGFYKQKARYLKAFARHIVDMYRGEISNMQERSLSELRDELLGIPGIGPETADSILLYALRMPSFVVDAYSYRLLDRLGLKLSPDYDSAKALFEDALKKDVKDLADMHALIVMHCKRQCARSPRCGDCCLSRCPSKRE